MNDKSKQHLSADEFQIMKSLDSQELWRRQFEAMGTYIEEGENLLASPLISQESFYSFKYLNLKGIGTEIKEGNDKSAKENRLEHINKQRGFIRSLAAGKIPFSILFSTSDGMSCIEYGVQEQKLLSLGKVLRAHFGRVDTGDEHAEDEEGWRYVISGQWHPKVNNEGAQDNEADDNMTDASWMTALGQSLLSDYAVRIFVYPAIYEDIKNRIVKIQELQEQLSMYVKLNIQSNVQTGQSSSKQPLAILTNALFGSDSQNAGSSFGISSERDVARLRFQIDSLETEAQRLREALISGGWQVSFSVFSNDKLKAQAVAAIISGVVTKDESGITWTEEKNYKSFNQHQPANNSSFWMTTNELSRLAELPDREILGFSLIANEDFNLQPNKKVNGIEIGNILWNGSDTGKKLSVEPKEFNRHAFICGMTGAGKSNTLFHILRSLRLPYTIIEPVKTEYRSLAQENPDINVWTMDSTDKKAMHINPFWFPEGGNLQFHMDAIKTIISSSFVLYAAMPNILEQCIYNIYTNCGWNVATGDNLYEGQLPVTFLYPTMSDLHEEVQRYLDNSGYEGETLSTYRGALATRLKSFTTGTKGLLLNTTEHPEYSVWNKRSQVIELDALSDDADKSIVMGSLLVQYYQHLKSGGISENIRHITVIEEAHRLFKNIQSNNQNTEAANPVGNLVETLTNMMAEIRAYGEGIIIADQSPTKVAPDVIKNSNIKIVHRLDSIDDAQVVANSLAIEKQGVLFSLLKQGEAVIRFEGMHKSAKVRVPLAKIRSKEEPVIRLREISNDWKHSPIADTILQNKRVQERVNSVMQRCVNHILYDDLQSANDFMTRGIEEISYILSSYGYSGQIVELNKNVYVHIMLEGFTKALRNNSVYGNHYKFVRLMEYVFERILNMICTQPLTPKEMDIFEQYRSIQIHALLQEIFSFSQEKRKEYNAVMSICGTETIYCDILVDLVSLQENSNELELGDLNFEAVKEFVYKNICDYFILLPSEVIIGNIALYLYMILNTANKVINQ
jgi:hypothetical protein